MQFHCLILQGPPEEVLSRFGSDIPKVVQSNLNNLNLVRNTFIILILAGNRVHAEGYTTFDLKEFLYMIDSGIGKEVALIKEERYQHDPNFKEGELVGYTLGFRYSIQQASQTNKEAWLAGKIDGVQLLAQTKIQDVYFFIRVMKSDPEPFKVAWVIEGRYPYYTLKEKKEVIQWNMPRFLLHLWGE
jgi:hypothetical protein